MGLPSTVSSGLHVACRRLTVTGDRHIRANVANGGTADVVQTLDRLERHSHWSADHTTHSECHSIKRQHRSDVLHSAHGNGHSTGRASAVVDPVVHSGAGPRGAPRFEELNGMDPIAYILATNITRCHLTKVQRAMALAKLTDDTQRGVARAKG